MKKIFSYSSFVPCYTNFSHGREGKLAVAWFSSQIPQNSKLFNIQSLKGCLFMNMEKNIDCANSTSSYLILTCRISNCELREMRISILKLSSISPILSWVTPPVDFVILATTSRGFFPYFEIPREYFLHNSQMSL
jgi:hypothetical protein